MYFWLLKTSVHPDPCRTLGVNFLHVPDYFGHKFGAPLDFFHPIILEDPLMKGDELRTFFNEDCCVVHVTKNAKL